jgi:hypothetical protein
MKPGTIIEVPNTPSIHFQILEELTKITRLLTSIESRVDNLESLVNGIGAILQEPK